MLKNSKGNVLFVEAENNGNMTVAVYKSLTAYNTNLKSPTQATQPDRMNVYIGNHLKDLIAASTTVPTGSTLAEVQASTKAIIKGLWEPALKARVAEDVKSFPRTKFDVVEFV